MTGHSPSVFSRSYPSWRIGAALALTLTTAFAVAAEPPDLALSTTVDLSPGADVYGPSQFALNRSTHRLYVFGERNGFRQNFGIKILDSRSGAVLAGADLGRYSDPFSPFVFDPSALAVDETPAPAGDKVYVLGSPGGGASSYLRVLDGETGASLTTEGTDLLLPLDGFRSRAGMVVNPSDHKVYVVDQNGKIAVIDGPNRSLVTTLQTQVGRDAILVGNPAVNKVLIFGQSGGAVIDCANDTFTAFEFPELNLQAAALHPGSNRVYVTGTTMDTGDSVILVVDGNTGASILTKTSGVPANASGITVDPAANVVYVAGGTYGSAGSIAAYRAADLSPAGTYNVSATSLLLDPVDGGRLLLVDLTRTSPEVGALNLATGVTKWVSVGYNPSALAINSKTSRAYITDRVTPELLVLDSGSREVTARVKLGASSFERGLAVSERLNRVYVTRNQASPDGGLWNAYLDVLNGETNELLDSLLVSSETYDADGYVAVDDVRRRIYVVRSQFDQAEVRFSLSLQVLDSDTHAIITTIPLPGGVTGLGVNPVTGRVYVAGNTPERPDAVTIINGETYSIVTTLPAGIGAGPMAINKATNKIYVANALRNSVTVIDGATDSSDPSLRNTEENNGNNAAAVAVDEASNRVFIADASNSFDFTGRVNVFDASNDGAYLGQIELGRYPTRILFDSTTRQLFVTNDDDGTVSVLQAGAPPPSTLVNIATRMRVGSGDDIIIGGFIVTGPEGSSKRVIVRAIGPSLSAAGVPGALQDPYLELYEGAGGFPLTRNNDWEEDSFDATELRNIGLAPTDAREAAVIRYLAPGSYTAVVAGAGYGTPRGGGTGVGLVEVYGLDRFSPVQIVNISTRGRVETGANVMIGGLILQGDGPARVIVRALGPSLSSSGVPGALQDPTLELYNGQGQLVRSNDNWRDWQESEITGTTIPPGDNKEAAIVATLVPGLYTAIVRGKDDATGVALVEAYNLQ